MIKLAHQFFPLIALLLGLASSQILKLALLLYKRKTLRFMDLFSSGDMPSTHCALLTSLTLAIALQDGWHSTSFFIALALTFVVSYDAMGVRRFSGYHAQRLNELEANTQTKGVNNIKLHEKIGHTPLEVYCGIFIGLASTLLLYYIIWQ